MVHVTNFKCSSFAELLGNPKWVAGVRIIVMELLDPKGCLEKRKSPDMVFVRMADQNKPEL
jgi:hypothetical protein